MTKTLRLALAASTALIALPFAATSAVAQSLPSNASVVGGSASISTPNASTMNVSVLQEKAIVNWDSFNVGAGNTVNFTNASASSNAAILNRVTGGMFSNISGNINGSGVDVYLINANGIIFGSTASVNVGSLTLSTRDVADADFLDGGNLNFVGAGSSGVIMNGGQITTNGRFAVISGWISTAPSTVISAGGDAVFAVGQNVTISEAGSPLSLTISQGIGSSDSSAIGGTVNARNAYFAAAAQSGYSHLLTVSGNVTATTASATDRGIILSGNVSGSGLTFAGGTATNGFSDITIGGSLRADQTQASDTAHITIFSNRTTDISGSLTAADDVNVSGYGSGTGILLRDGASLTATTGRNVINNATALHGAATFVSGGDTIFAYTVDKATSTGSIDATSTGGNVRFNNNVNVASIQASAINGDVTGFSLATTGDVTLTGRNVNVGTVIAGRDLTATATAGNAQFTTTNTTRHTTLAASGLLIQNNVTVGGNYSITAPDFSGGFNPTLSAGSNFTITDTQGGLVVSSLSAPGTLTLNTLNGGDLTQLAGTLQGGTGIALSTSGGGMLSLEGTLNTPGQVSLVSSNGILQGPSAAIVAGSLTGSTVGAANLLGFNQVGRLLTFSSADNFNFRNTTALTVEGAVSAGASHTALINVTGAGSDLIINNGAGGSVTGRDVTLTAGRNLDAQRVAATRDATLTASSGTISVGTGTSTGTAIESGRDITLTGSAITLRSGSNLSATSDINVNGAVTLAGPATLTAGDAIAFSSVINQAAGAGPLTVTSGTGTTFGANVGGGGMLHSLVVNGAATLNGTVRTVQGATFDGNVTSSGNVDVASTSGTVSLLGSVSANNGGILLSGVNVVAGEASRTTAWNAAGSINLTATGGSVTGNGALTLTSNIDGIGAEAITLSGAGAGASINFGSDTHLRGGLARQSDVQIRSGASSNSVVLGNVTARGLLGAVGASGFTTGLALNGAIAAGIVALTNDLDLQAGTVTLGGATVDGGINLQASAGDLSTGNLSAGGTLTASASNAATLGAASGGQVIAAGDVNVTGGTVTTRGLVQSSGGTLTLSAASGALTAGNATSAGLMTLSGPSMTTGVLTSNASVVATGNGDKTIAGIVTQGVGDVTINGTGSVVIGSGGTAIDAARNVTIGNVTAPTSITVNGAIQAGTSTTLTAGTIDVDDINSGGNTTLQGNSGAVSFASLSGNNVSIVMPSTNSGGISGQNITGRTNVSLNAGNGAINVTGVVDTPLLDYASTSATFGGANRIAALAGSTGGLVLNNSVNLAVNGVLFGGARDVTIHTSGDLTIGSGGSISGNLVALSAAGTFVNNRGNDAVSALDRWAVYLTSPSGHVYGGLDSNNNAIWNGTLASKAPGSFTGNRYVFAYQPTLTLTTTGASKVYGDDLTGALSGMYTVSGLQAGVAGAFLGDTAASVFSGAPIIASTGAAANADVAGGPYAVTASQGSVALLNGYSLVLANNGQITITPKAITATVVADDKIYDRTTAGTGTVTLNGILDGDIIGTAGTTFTFADKNAGADKAVTVAGTTLTGSDAGNYTLTVPASVLADILKREITASVAANDKTYDGTTSATGTTTLNGIISGDTVGTTGTTFTFTNKNAGADKAVTVAGTTLTGSDSGNYTLTIPASVLADILKKEITASAVANDKIYDGTTSATGTITLNGVISGDTVGTAGTTFTFTDKNAGADKAVTVAGTTLAGGDAGNYTLTVPASVLADILKREITASIAANDKTYDGTTSATGTTTLNGIISGDTVETTGTTFTFADKNAGTDKTVTVAGTTLTGTDAANYAVTVPASVLANILRRAITVAAADTTKSEGASDPAFTYAVTSGSLVAGDSLTGTLAREGGEAPGRYAIGQGSLTASANYALTFTRGTFVIEALAPQPQPDPVTDPNDDFAGFVAVATNFSSTPAQSEAEVLDASGAFCGSDGAAEQECSAAR